MASSRLPIIIIFIISVNVHSKQLPISYATALLSPKHIQPTIPNVKCPGGEAECPSGNTCCKLEGGSYGCCPLPKAVCCADHVHCCPNGYTCDTGAGTCSSGSDVVAMVKKQTALQVSSINTVQCPGGEAECPAGNTCCKLEGGSYGCCPLPKAVCCADHVHCCPNGYTCDTGAGTCSSGSDVVAMVKKQTALQVSSINAVQCPGGEAECPAGNTCCKLEGGSYGCCPLPKAVCCADHVHCCPNGYTCDTGAGTCSSGSDVVAMVKKQTALQVSSINAVQCPGGEAECPSGNTCCKLAGGSYGCCPLPKAVCCADHVHCCPNGYTCDTGAGTCNRGSDVVAMVKKQTALQVSSINAVQCPGGEAECPAGNTCCKLEGGSYGCCPLPKAVCCADHVHCCPNGYTCDTGAETCNRGSDVVAMVKKQTALQVSSINAVQCPGGEAECPSGNTCCKLEGGSYGCCPLPKAVCCADHVHCCPNGYTCDTGAGTCNRGSDVVAMVKKQTALQVSSINAVQCPGGEAECPAGNTCCKLEGGSYGCCPLPKAVCCADHVHCCPNGYTCDTGAGTCNRGSDVVAMVKKQTALQVSSINAVQCPGGEAECPAGNTCCKLEGGSYGCCPLPKAVCCADHVHCCPNGYTCDTGAGTCNCGSDVVAMVKKQTALQVSSINAVQCPGGEAECPSGNTCCKLEGGSYGCCPLPKAVCCADHVHCCPNGYTCDTGAGTCNRGSDVVAMVKKQTALQVSSINAVQCPGGEAECPSGNTCCKLEGGSYGCCPLPKAVCCADHVHCCPNGYTCDTGAGTCNRGSDVVAMVKKQTALQVSSINAVQCPGGEAECPSGNTCCKLEGGSYGCCPLPKAVCCADHVHCCPNGYTCDTGAGTCNRGGDVVAMVKKQTALQVSSIDAVQCPGGEAECPAGNTCCKLAGGSYGCCPLPKAVCCADHVHCCPNGYTCDTGTGTCSSGSDVVAMVKKQTALQVSSINAVQCPGGEAECPSGNTCCKLEGGSYGCCPLPKAVCCADHVHCCPNGYTCDTGAGTCNRGSDVVAMVKKQTALQVSSINAVQCPGGEAECPSGNTCCKLEGGSYGCCPLPKAVCCADHVHCCPNGYTCDTGAGTCNRGSDVVAMVKKQTALQVSSINAVQCPGGEAECPSGNTCCKLEGGSYGCCPLPKAVCCADHVHCCPNGYTCDTGAGTCNRGSDVVVMVKKQTALQVSSINAVQCPGGEAECPAGNTCCKLEGGSYGCCPLPKAVCCADHVHCCPNGYTCDTGAGTCNRGSDVVAMVKKQTALQVSSINAVQCPGGEAECPSGNTCCKLEGGSYGCCPLPKAVCCADHVHCCPNGYTCDTGAGTCNRGSDVVAMVKKQTALQVSSINAVQCPGGEAECPSGNTCCKLEGGSYGCCPLPKAVCCADHVHCCPNGYTCDTGAGTCNRGSDVVVMVKKQTALQVSSINAVQCPGGEAECPAGNTCCKLEGGSYGCCPLPKAVCCADHVHCCPNGYTCDTGAGTCNRGSDVVAMVKKQTALQVSSINAVQCPGGEAECPSGNTCCKLEGGSYGCCPLPKAVCCADHVHCCPNGYTCDTGAGTCNRGSDVVAMVKKQTALQVSSINAVQCPGGEAECPAGNTCCKLEGGSYGCCPLPKAVCCADHVHCCPNGYTCDTGTGTCNRGSDIVAMVKKQIALKVSSIKNIVCPDNRTECPPDNTCCKLEDLSYGCCPLPNAVCCSDHSHCCPNGYMCDPEKGTCYPASVSVKSGLLSSSSRLSPKMAINAVGLVVCPDMLSFCPDGETCCKLPSGEYGCCPYQNAVCCSDGKHCCPSGYRCSSKSGLCENNMIQQQRFIPLTSLVSSIAIDSICPDGKAKCSSGSTCCLTKTGQYGCCPVASGVCCSDHIHCCPHGSTCDLMYKVCVHATGKLSKMHLPNIAESIELEEQSNEHYDYLKF